ncbi:MAG TPA: 1,4-dihydroxy-6-naphthoate synthase [Nitrospirae bacterium]|nr:1,4-dihydroxy-6-naphthoate synthase [Nitrospirota bacterium]
MFTFGFSPCPNDTYIFYALTKGLLDTKGFNFDFKIEDVETLNYAVLRGELDISKVSCHAYYYVRDKYIFLRKGSAFGRGCGPLIVSKKLTDIKDLSGSKIAIPGKFTTAFLLLRLFVSEMDLDISKIVVMPYNEIIKSLDGDSVDAGLIIHESRFTYGDYGLNQLIDLGKWWQEDTGLPIPLGGIIAKRTFGEKIIKTVEDLISESISFADRNYLSVIPFIKSYAQELSDEVIRAHIDLYVNDYSRNWHVDCERALERLINKLKGAKDKWLKF